jgi:hypothetical protein
MHLLELEQAAARAALEKQQGRGLFKNAPPGQTIEEVRALLDQAQAKERTDLAVDVAKATVASITEQRDKQLAEIRARAQIAPPAEQAALFAEQNRLFLSFLPKINEAVKLANGILAKLPPSEAVREAQARNALVLQQARRPEAIGTGEAAAVSAISAPLQAEIEISRSRLDNIVESVKVSGVSASAALESIFTFSKKSVADLKAISESTNAGLRSVMAEAGTTAAEKSKLQAQIEANVNAPGKAAVDAQNAVMAVLAEEKAKLDKLLAEYKQAVTDLENKIRDSRLSPIQAATERAKLDQRFIPEIARQGQQYGQVAQQAQRGAEAAGFSPAFRAELAAEQQRAATLSNEQSNRSASARKAAQDNLTIGKTALATMNESIRTQQELLKAGATTQTEAENATREAHEEATKAVKNLEPEIQKNIDALNEMGDNQGAKKLAADFKLLQTQVAYVDPLVQQITTGLEQSFTGRGGCYRVHRAGVRQAHHGAGEVQGFAWATQAGVRQFHRRHLGGCRFDHHQIHVAESHQGCAGSRAGRRCGRRCGGWLASLFSSGSGAAGGSGSRGGTPRLPALFQPEERRVHRHWSLVLSTMAAVSSAAAACRAWWTYRCSATRSGSTTAAWCCRAMRYRSSPSAARRSSRWRSSEPTRRRRPHGTDGAERRVDPQRAGRGRQGDRQRHEQFTRRAVVLNVLQRNAPTVKKWVG